MKYGDFWPDLTELIFTLNLSPPDIKYAYSILFSMHFLWFWRRIKYAQKSASFQIGDNFRLSHDFIVWFRDTVVWHSLQIKWMIRLRSWASFTFFFLFQAFVGLWNRQYGLTIWMARRRWKRVFDRLVGDLSSFFNLHPSFCGKTSSSPFAGQRFQSRGPRWFKVAAKGKNDLIV